MLRNYHVGILCSWIGFFILNGSALAGPTFDLDWNKIMLDFDKPISFTELSPPYSLDAGEPKFEEDPKEEELSPEVIKKMKATALAALLFMEVNKNIARDFKKLAKVTDPKLSAMAKELDEIFSKVMGMLEKGMPFLISDRASPVVSYEEQELYKDSGPMTIVNASKYFPTFYFNKPVLIEGLIMQAHLDYHANYNEPETDWDLGIPSHKISYLVTRLGAYYKLLAAQGRTTDHPMAQMTMRAFDTAPEPGTDFSPEWFRLINKAGFSDFDLVDRLEKSRTVLLEENSKEEKLEEYRGVLLKVATSVLDTAVPGFTFETSQDITEIIKQAKQQQEDALTHIDEVKEDPTKKEAFIANLLTLKTLAGTGVHFALASLVQFGKEELPEEAKNDLLKLRMTLACVDKLYYALIENQQVIEIAKTVNPVPSKEITEEGKKRMEAFFKKIEMEKKMEEETYLEINYPYGFKDLKSAI